MIIISSVENLVQDRPGHDWEFIGKSISRVMTKRGQRRLYGPQRVDEFLEKEVSNWKCKKCGTSCATDGPDTPPRNWTSKTKRLADGNWGRSMTCEETMVNLIHNS